MNHFDKLKELEDMINSLIKQREELYSQIVTSELSFKNVIVRFKFDSILHKMNLIIESEIPISLHTYYQHTIFSDENGEVTLSRDIFDVGVGRLILSSSSYSTFLTFIKVVEFKKIIIDNDWFIIKEIVEEVVRRKYA